MKIGLLFGSFRRKYPLYTSLVTLSSLITWRITQHSIRFGWWFPRKIRSKNTAIWSTYDRLEMCKLATDNSKNLEVRRCRVEAAAAVLYHWYAYPSKREKYPQHEFALIMGSDNTGIPAQMEKLQANSSWLPDLCLSPPGYENTDLATHLSVLSLWRL